MNRNHKRIRDSALLPKGECLKEELYEGSHCLEALLLVLLKKKSTSTTLHAYCAGGWVGGRSHFWLF